MRQAPPTSGSRIARSLQEARNPANRTKRRGSAPNRARTKRTQSPLSPGEPPLRETTLPPKDIARACENRPAPWRRVWPRLWEGQTPPPPCRSDPGARLTTTLSWGIVKPQALMGGADALLRLAHRRIGHSDNRHARKPVRHHDLHVNGQCGHSDDRRRFQHALQMHSAPRSESVDVMANQSTAVRQGQNGYYVEAHAAFHAVVIRQEIPGYSARSAHASSA